jgi:hypothetical protein
MLSKLSDRFLHFLAFGNNFKVKILLHLVDAELTIGHNILLSIPCGVVEAHRPLPTVPKSSDRLESTGAIGLYPTIQIERSQ